jgi:protein ImuB
VRVHETERILAIQLEFNSHTRRYNRKSLAEIFLKFSPRVQFREPDWIFIEVSTTLHLFKSDQGLLTEVESLIKQLGFNFRCAIADTASGAQAFASSATEIMTIVPAGQERDQLKLLSLFSLSHLEGLRPWSQPAAIKNIAAFFLMLGFSKVDDLSQFTFASFQERWGETGALLWKRMHGQDRQVVSPLVPTEPLSDFIHLEFPISLVSLLLQQLQKTIEFLFIRLGSRCFFAHKLCITLHCEYSNLRHTFEISPNQPSRNCDLFFTLIENRLGKIELLNPVRDIEIHVIPCPEQVRQLDFFEPRTTDQDKLDTLLSLLDQANVKPGFYKIELHPLPEKSWNITIKPAPDSSINSSDKHSTKTSSTKQVSAPRSMPTHKPPPAASLHQLALYGASIQQAPRPTRMLRIPRQIGLRELETIKILSTSPIERIESDWWNKSRSSRDYYFALSRDGQCLWIFYDLLNKKYFLHGYFD